MSNQKIEQNSYQFHKNMEASIVTTFIQIIVGMAVYGALLIITRDKFIFRIINRIFKKREER